MYDIAMNTPTPEFIKAWAAAGRHLSKMGDDSLPWIKCAPEPPFLEHLSFRLGNQVFFIQIEDVDGALDLPCPAGALFVIADGWKSHACLMPMKNSNGVWEPLESGWGLLDAKTRLAINPVDYVSEERIPMTPWEIQDFAVLVVRNHLADEGFEIMSYNNHPGVKPSIWFVGPEGPEWVVVRAIRLDDAEEEPENLTEVVKSCEHLSKKGNRASVFLMSEADFMSLDDKLSPLYRGMKIMSEFAGLELV